MEVLDLVDQITVFTRIFRREAGGDWALHPVGPKVEDFSDFSIFDPSIKLSARLAVTAHQTNSDLEVLLLGLFIKLKHLAGGVAIRRDGFSMKTLRFFSIAYSK